MPFSRVSSTFTGRHANSPSTASAHAAAQSAAHAPRPEVHAAHCARRLVSGWRAGWDRHPRWRKAAASVLAVLLAVGLLAGCTGQIDYDSLTECEQLEIERQQIANEYETAEDMPLDVGFDFFEHVAAAECADPVEPADRIPCTAQGPLSLTGTGANAVKTTLCEGRYAVTAEVTDNADAEFLVLLDRGEGGCLIVADIDGTGVASRESIRVQYGSWIGCVPGEFTVRVAAVGSWTINIELR